MKQPDEMTGAELIVLKPNSYKCHALLKHILYINKNEKVCLIKQSLYTN